MGRRVLVEVNCEWCQTTGTEGEEGAPTDLDWTWNGTPLRTQVCPDCRNEANEAVSKLLEISDVVKPPPTPRKKMARPPGSKTQLVDATDQAVEAPPARRQLGELGRGSFHKFYNEEYGLFDCPYPGCDRVDADGFPTPPSLGNHHSQTHGRKIPKNQVARER